MNATPSSPFAHAGIAEISECFPAAQRAFVAAEIDAALTDHGVRRDIRVAATGDTPRRYRVLGRDDLFAHAPQTAALYRSPRLRAIIESAVGEPVFDVPYVPEECIATRLEAAGDTHGWHWDDYAFALVWILQAPAIADGGVLECVRDTRWNKNAPDVEALVASHTAERYAFAAGSVYVLRSDTTLHRVTPLLGDLRRDALCFTYARAADLTRTVSHETLHAIYATS